MNNDIAVCDVATTSSNSDVKKMRLMNENELKVVRCFVNGELRSSQPIHAIDNMNPATGERFAVIESTSAHDVSIAVQSAKEAFPLWSCMAVGERSAVLNQIADLLEQRIDEFAFAESQDTGTPITVSKMFDLPLAVQHFRFYASACQHHMNASRTMDGSAALSYTTRSPVGVVGIICSWNRSLCSITQRIAPAIAAGNTVVAKPSPHSSVTAFKFCSLLQDTDLPGGVVNMVFGADSVGECMVNHPHIALIAFSGSTRVGRRVQQASAAHCKKLSLELGTNNAAIVFADADLDTCIDVTIKAAFRHQGQLAESVSRLFVHRQVFQSFVDRFVSAARRLRLGAPSDADTEIGAITSPAHLVRLRAHVEQARADSAQVLCGEGVDGLQLEGALSGGSFMLPTVITDVSDTARLMQEPVGGPIVCLLPFANEEEVVARANSVKFGLCASVWTSDVGRTLRIGQRLQVGTVWVNCWLLRDLNMPHGGCKHSGIGREGFHESIDFYTQVKTVCVKI